MYLKKVRFYKICQDKMKKTKNNSPFWLIPIKIAILSGLVFVAYLFPSWTLIAALVWDFYKIYQSFYENNLNLETKVNTKIKLQVFGLLAEAILLIWFFAYLWWNTEQSINWQILLATSLLVIGVKIFIQIKEENSFSWTIISDNFVWIGLLITSILARFLPSLDLLVGILLAVFILFENLQTLFKDLNQKVIEIEKSEPKVEEELQILDLNDEIVARLQSIPKMKHIYKTMVTKIKDKDLVTVVAVVNNNCNQEELFEIKTRVKKILKRLGFAGSTVEIEYEAEFRGLV